jgi:TrmH family RNA methyltransferase
MITSTDNSQIKIVSSLHHKKGRLEHNLYLAEGIHPVWEAVRAGAGIKQFFWSAKLTSTLEGRQLLGMLQAKYDGQEVSENVFAKIGETDNPQGILATVSIPQNPSWDFTDLTLGLIIDGLQDPGNIGAIIRTAWAGGLDGLFFTPGTADPYQGKVVRASMGGVFFQKIYRDIEPEIIFSQAFQAGIQIVAGDPEAELNIFDHNFLTPTLLLVGNEAKGITSNWENISIKRVKIPQPGRAESLNAAVATGILIYESIRQRLIMDTCKN